VLDEPSLGLSPQAMKMVFDAIRELTAFGLSGAHGRAKRPTGAGVL
jgi:hypothetical protein